MRKSHLPSQAPNSLGQPSEAENAKIPFKNIRQILTVYHAIISPLILHILRGRANETPQS